jgi:hypothetical protein
MGNFVVIEKELRLGIVVYCYNPSYSGGRDWKISVQGWSR